MQAPLPSPFDRQSSAQDVAQGIDLTGKHAVITGATAGLGTETARVLARCGAKVTLLGRNQQAGDNLADTIRAQTGNPNVHMRAIDLNQLSEIKIFADNIVQSDSVVDLLINNAGVMAAPLERCEFGFESQLFINYVSHLVLSAALTPALLKSISPRVVSLTSLGHHMSAVDLNDPNFERRKYNKWLAYGQSKTASSLLAVYLHQRLGMEGVISTAVHPGSIEGTNLSRYLSPEEYQAAMSSDNSATKTLEQGAATTVWASTSPLLEQHGGTYLEDCNIAKVIDKPNFKAGVLPYAIAPDTADQLASWTQKLLGNALGRIEL